MLKDIAPQHKSLLIDLVREAGVSVSPWADSKRGEAGAARNPKYCFEWSFVQPGHVVVLNFWHHKMREETPGAITVDTNMREFADERPEPERNRAINFDSAIQTAIECGLPIRVIVLAGARRGDAGGPADGPSKVTERMLDPVAWGVESYDPRSGQCRLRRGLKTVLQGTTRVQFPDVDEDDHYETEGRSRWAMHLRRERSPKLVAKKKEKVKAEKGRLACEVCGFDFSEFYRRHAQDFCEVHHRKPLAELDGAVKTKLEDLAIMCSNCHRVIHRIKPIMPTVEELKAELSRRRG